MKVIKTAKENNNVWRKQVTCSGKGWSQGGKTPCWSLLEIGPEDIKARNHTDISGCTDTYYGFECCKCGCFTELPSNQIPEDVKHAAKKY